MTPVYVASRASVPERGVMWRQFRNNGFLITSSWIDEDGEGQTTSMLDLWKRIESEITQSRYLVLYAEEGDFPLKGALIEAGIALGMGKPVVVCLPNVEVHPRSCRPIGSWIHHPHVLREDNVQRALSMMGILRGDSDDNELPGPSGAPITTELYETAGQSSGPYATKDVVSEFAHVIAVLKEIQRPATTMNPEKLKNLVNRAIQSGSALVEILRSHRSNETAPTE